jgi:probable F420-dependent oxidoreductase
MTGAAVALSQSTRMVVATGIAQIYARDAMATAAASKTLAAWSGGRFVLGLGVSHRPTVERARKGTYDPPIAAMRSFLDAFDEAPNMSEEHATPVPRVLAALGPKMLQLAATRADGALPYLVTPEHTAIARASLGPDGFLAVEQAVVLDEDRVEFLRRAHEHLNIYTGLENYRNSWRRLGFTDQDFVRGGSDRLCDALVVHGDESAIARVIDEHRRAGADHVCVQVLGSTTTDVPLLEWERLGAAVPGRQGG